MRWNECKKPNSKTWIKMQEKKKKQHQEKIISMKSIDLIVSFRDDSVCVRIPNICIHCIYMYVWPDPCCIKVFVIFCVVVRVLDVFSNSGNSNDFDRLTGWLAKELKMWKFIRIHEKRSFRKFSRCFLPACQPASLPATTTGVRQNRENRLVCYNIIYHRMCMSMKNDERRNKQKKNCVNKWRENCTIFFNFFHSVRCWNK